MANLQDFLFFLTFTKSLKIGIYYWKVVFIIEKFNYFVTKNVRENFAKIYLFQMKKSGKGKFTSVNKSSCLKAGLPRESYWAFI